MTRMFLMVILMLVAFGSQVDAGNEQCQVHDLRAVVVRLRELKTDTHKSVSSLQQEDKDLKTSITSLTEENANLKTSMLSLHQEDEDLKTSITSLTEENANLKSSLTSLTEAVANLTNVVSSQQSNSVKVSAFTATTPTGPTGGFAILTFTGVILNEGGNYNPSTGQFTCSIPGIYFFTISLVKRRLSVDGKYDRVYAYIRQNGSEKVLASIDPDDGDADNGSYGVTATVTLRLLTGDVVDVAGGPVVASMEAWSMFSGFIIQSNAN